MIRGRKVRKRTIIILVIVIASAILTGMGKMSTDDFMKIIMMAFGYGIGSVDKGG